MTNHSDSNQLLPLIEAALAIADKRGLEQIGIHLDMARVLAAALPDHRPPNPEARH